MAADLKKAVNNALAALPSPEEVRRRIAENLQERQQLRRILKLVEQRRPSTVTREGRRYG